jgi:hypothetical protein
MAAKMHSLLSWRPCAHKNEPPFTEKVQSHSEKRGHDSLPTCQHACTHAPKSQIAALPMVYPIHGEQARLKVLLCISIQKLVLVYEFEMLILTAQ